MIKFFRHIRQRLLAESKFGKYLIYASGEIILVVIGILIALAINSNQQYRKDRSIELGSLQKFTYDLKQDSITMQGLIQREEGISADLDTLYTLLQTQDNANKFKVFEKSATIGSSSFFNANTGTYDEAVATGTMQTIQDDSLRSQLFAYYRLVKINGNDRITDEYQNREIVPVLLDVIAPTREAVQFVMEVDNPLLESIDLKSMLENPDFNKIIVWRKGNSSILIENWMNFLEENQKLSEMIRNELREKAK